MDAANEVKTRLHIEDVIGEYVDLKRAGRNLKALSPFTSERTPSFIVSPEKGIWHDFSSNQGGDVFTFIMKVEGLTFREALEKLAQKANVDLSKYNFKTNPQAAAQKKKLFEILELTTKFFQKSLVANPKACDYAFYKRHFTRQTIADFRIGYAPNSQSALTDLLTKRGYSTKELSAAGLLNRFDRDLFKGRLMIPLMDPEGRIIGFTGRQLLPDENSPKYLNTPETLLYDKSRHIFALSQAKESIRKKDLAIIVEGNLDVVSSHQVGVTNVVATAGTAMTEDHLKILARFTQNICLAYDEDAAGIKATERAIEIASKLGLELSIISDYDGAKDPDELIQRDPKLWEKAIASHQPAVDWLLSVYEKKLDLNSAPGKRKYSTIALKLISQLSDEVEKDHYYQQIAKKLNISEDALKSKLSDLEKALASSMKPKKSIKTDISNEDADFLVFDQILTLTLIYPKLRPRLSDLSTSDPLRAPILEHLQGSLDKMPPESDNYTQELLLAEERYANWSTDDLSHTLDALLESLRIEKLKKQKSSLLSSLADAESLGQDTSDLLDQINTLNKELKNAQKI